MIPNRIPKSASICQWQTSDDGLYQWAEDCNISGVGSPLTVNFRPSVIPTMIACAEQCKANLKCNNFIFQANTGSQCSLYSSPGLTPDLKYVGPRRTVGMITARKFNVEFLPTKQHHQCKNMPKNITKTEPVVSKNRPIAASPKNDDGWYWIE